MNMYNYQLILMHIRAHIQIRAIQIRAMQIHAACTQNLIMYNTYIYWNIVHLHMSAHTHMHTCAYTHTHIFQNDNAQFLEEQQIILNNTQHNITL